MKPELLKYHPVRYEYNLRHLINDISADYHDAPKEELDKYRGQLIPSIFINYLEQFLSENPGFIPVGMDKASWSRYKEELFTAYIKYVSRGENIFHLQPELFAMFQRTDVSQVLVDELRAPFDAMYLYFGGSLDFPIGEGKYIDGAYIESNNEEHLIFLYLTTTGSRAITGHATTSHDVLDAINSESHLYYLLIGEQSGETVGTSVEETIKEAGFENYNKAQFRLWEPHLKAVTNIVINALCFLSSEHNDEATRFPDTCPRSFTEKYENASTEKQRNRILSKASSQGFKRIKFIGDTFKGINRGNGENTVSVHWRRGHWRHQAHGSARSMHKLIWIKPTIVNKDKGDPTIKHIYQVE